MADETLCRYTIETNEQILDQFSLILEIAQAHNIVVYLAGENSKEIKYSTTSAISAEFMADLKNHGISLLSRCAARD